MSAIYRAVQWNRHKRVYDGLLALGVVGFIAAFFVVSKLTWTGDHAIADEVLILRGVGVAALVLLHIILCIGPLARLDPRFAPLLYNRRHLGVTMFLLALVHGLLSIGYYHGFGVVSPIQSLLTANTRFGSLHAFPFELLGLAALAILFLMAATSHDFWLANLGPRAWKSLHMLVYPAYGLLVMHVALGAMQSERSVLYPLLLGAGVVIVSTLHLVAGSRSHAPRHEVHRPGGDWIDLGDLSDLPDGRARRVTLRGAERIAVFRHGDRVSALSDLCAHQHGPLSEGRIIDGCVTCPWHGYQYVPRNGQSPPPFTQRIATYRVRVDAGRVWVHPNALPPGADVEPAVMPGSDAPAPPR